MENEAESRNVLLESDYVEIRIPRVESEACGFVLSCVIRQGSEDRVRQVTGSSRLYLEKRDEWNSGSCCPPVLSPGVDI